MNIYITGIDGAGKSSIIERLKTDFFKNEKVVGFNLNILF